MYTRWGLKLKVKSSGLARRETWKRWANLRNRKGRSEGSARFSAIWVCPKSLTMLGMESAVSYVSYVTLVSCLREAFDCYRVE